MAALVAAAPAHSRLLEPRVSGGFAWAPYRPSAAPDPALASAVGNALITLRGGLEPGTRHTAGIAQLLAGRPRQALSNLAGVAEAGTDPRAWSDLAVAYHESAVRYEAPELVADALEACDRALSFDPDLPEALFNRALMIERLGLRDDARQAWERYLEHDPGSDWASEAREHLRALAPETPFLQLLERSYDRMAGIEALVRHDPQSARARTEMEVLGRWGQAVMRGDHVDSERHLRVAREIGLQVARVNGYRMLQRAVAAIDGADAPARASLAAAHADYDGGLRAFQDNRPVDAEPLLRRAAGRFQQGSSPMALRARYFAANVAFEQGRHEEARRELETMLASVPDGSDAYRAELLWELGVCHATRAEWGTAIRILEESIAIFERLGESQNAAAVRRIIVVIYERTGDTTTAWKDRMLALRGIGKQSDLALVKAVASIAESAMLRRNWRTALSFLDLEIEISRRMHDDVELGDALLVRSVVHDRMGEPARAAADIAEAEEAAGRVQDPAFRQYFRAAWLRARAMGTASPAEANSLLTEAIAFQATKGARMNLPALYLLRARALRKSGDAAAAMADLGRGIAEMETHRASLPPGEARWGAFHADEELFEEAIDLALDRSDVAAAFGYTEKARARALLESYGTAAAAGSPTLPLDTVVVEYVTLPSRLVIFTADRASVQAVSVDCDRSGLAAEVDALVRLLRTNQVAAGKAASAALYRRLVEPVAVRLLGAKTVAFVPDASTAIVPFSALLDSGGAYLIERHAVVIAPSTAVYASAATRHGSAPQSVLVIANAGADSERLAFVDDETRDVVRAYRKNVPPGDDDDGIEAIARQAVDVIHFAGHAVGDDSGFEPASMLLWQKGTERRISVGAIARMRLLRPSIVVLAGCSTARGERRASEGVISVAHGFLTAGAPSVVATLWPIEDEAAARFFPRLHERLSQGLAPAEALRAVQIESIRRGDVPPSLWAAVQDIGS